MPENPALFSPLELRSVRLRNRIGVSPMCMYACEPDGLATPWHLVHLGARAAGGAALVVAEATAVAPEARISAADLGLWSHAHARALEPVAAFIEAQGAVAGVQLAHAGRKGSTQVPWVGRRWVPPGEGGWTVQAPSPLAFGPHSAPPRQMQEADIARAIAQFAHAARHAVAAGFRYVELHLGHGYLAHQFLSPLTNQRDDAWGGCFEHRVRFAREVARAVRAVLPDTLALAARLSVSDWLEGGWEPTQALRLGRLLKEDGVDLVVCSSGAIAPGSAPPGGPGAQPPYAARMRAEANVRSGAVGAITEPSQAEALIASAGADLVFLARAMLRNPNWPLHAAQALGAPAPWPKPYARAVGG
ncbi:oxidoreductase [Hydrogenophaga sp. BPS33]|uniref:oxidoreductase n=1 Tax=Hydrogenophaga sp. BPS33 TaxID=2651974 RepID=UPI00131F7AA6|nr:oxidoreductase [Hydrogenophaga sp. BPS33]QHE84590.1 oxidoreductase [Hydrogenophaga sp. BPS33]